MPPYGEPDWATPGDTSTPTTQDAGTTSQVAGAAVAGSNRNTGERNGKVRCFLMGLSLINMGLAVMMGSLGVMTLINLTINVAGDLTEAFLGAYMVLFASILFLYELCWWQPFPAINRTFRRNFGFMYGLYSKGFYLIFIAFLTIGLIDGDNKSGVAYLDWATGISWLFFGVFHIFIGFAWPDVVDAYKPPIAGLNIGSTTDNVV